MIVAPARCALPISARTCATVRLCGLRLPREAWTPRSIAGRAAVWSHRPSSSPSSPSSPLPGSTLALAEPVQTRQLTVEPAGTLRATGTVEGPVDNSGTVDATNLTVRGAYTQRPGARLTATRMSVTGAVTLAGTFAPDPAHGPGVIIDNQGTAQVSGTFDGLPEGAAVGTLRLTYHGGDGNYVVLTGQSDKTGPDATTRQAASSFGPLWWFSAAGALVLLIAIVFLARRRSRNRNA